VFTIEVTAGATGIEAGYSISLTFDHAALVSRLGAKPDGSDLVIRTAADLGALYFTLDPESSWNADDTTVWFALTSSLGAGQTALYELEVTTLTLITTGDWDDVFLAGDDFEDGSLSARLTPFTNLGATIAETGGGLVIDMGDDQAEAAIVSSTVPIPQDRRFAIRHRMRLDSVFGDDNAHNVKAIGIVQWPEQPQYAPNNVYGENRRQRVILNHGKDGQSWAYYYDATGQQRSWNGTDWQDGYHWWGVLPLGRDHIFELDSDGETFTLAVRSEAGDELMRTPRVPWTDVFVREQIDPPNLSVGPFWFYWGEVYVTGEPLPDGGVTGGPYYTADLRSEYVLYRRRVAPEPTAVLRQD
jgi:hypothetical protein